MKFFDNIKSSLKNFVTLKDDDDYDDDENYGDDEYDDDDEGIREEEAYDDEPSQEEVKYSYDAPASGFGSGSGSGFTAPEYHKGTGGSASFSSAPSGYSKNASANIYKMDSVKTAKKLKITLFVLEDTDDAINVADCMLDKGIVTLADMTKLPTESVRRVLDFLDGVKYACKSKIEIISDKIYLIVPEAAELSGDFFGQVDRPSFF